MGHSCFLLQKSLRFYNPCAKLSNSTFCRPKLPKLQNAGRCRLELINSAQPFKIVFVGK